MPPESSLELSVESKKAQRLCILAIWDAGALGSAARHCERLRRRLRSQRSIINRGKPACGQVGSRFWGQLNIQYILVGYRRRLVLVGIDDDIRNIAIRGSCLRVCLDRQGVQDTKNVVKRYTDLLIY